MYTSAVFTSLQNVSYRPSRCYNNMINNNQTVLDQRTSGNDVIDGVDHSGQKKERHKSMQYAHLCTVWAGGQLTGEVGRQKGTDHVCMQGIYMQLYSNTYGHMCSNQSYQVGGIYRGSRGVPACKQNFGYRHQ